MTGFAGRFAPFSVLMLLSTEIFFLTLSALVLDFFWDFLSIFDCLYPTRIYYEENTIFSFWDISRYLKFFSVNIRQKQNKAVRSFTLKTNTRVKLNCKQSKIACCYRNSNFWIFRSFPLRIRPQSEMANLKNKPTTLVGFFIFTCISFFFCYFLPS